MPHTFESKNVKAKLSISLNKLVLLTFLAVIAYFGYEKYALHNAEQTQASVFILTPQVNDIYFLDMRLINNKLNPNQKTSRFSLRVTYYLIVVMPWKMV
ncbi:hypothetical protein A3Q34_04140 [Colwellia sp. PAMC 20917]|uniref:hypothetical protein n=1 Tax=Colwellia sp. PAMC 20917 TaxID=1816218 RepID=UPI0008787F1C|nr:hypothetical protein [Colwellia sp. PAMC 20917]AOW76113.1 hypothetical protein A3Q34_04140 [Colwellia sp. PAMC 20917]